MFDGFFSYKAVKMITHIIWDYNGTIVNDVLASVEAVNFMLDNRGLEHTDIEAYKNNIDMPILNYYKTVGICDDVSKLSIEYRQGLMNNSHLISIFEGVRDVIEAANKKGIKSILLSSLYHEYLIEEVTDYGIKDLFYIIQGMPDRYVGSKTQNAIDILNEEGILPENVLCVGDLKSDAELARSIGADCLLVDSGHMSRERLEKTGFKVVSSICDVVDFL